MDKYSILLVDDHPIFLQGLELVIESFNEFTVVGCAHNSKEALDLIRLKKPQLAIVDLNLGNEDGLELIRQIDKEFPLCKCLVLSMLEEQHYAERALLAGAKGYITKDEVAEILLEAIKRVQGGEIWLSKKEKERHINAFFSNRAKISGAKESIMVDKLSDRQLRIFSLIGKGFGTIEIAEELSISRKTVEAHKSHIKEKLWCKSSRDLLQMAIEWSNRNINALEKS